MKESDLVKRGNRIFQIDPREKKAQLTSKKASIVRAEAARVEIQNYESVRASALANIAARQAVLEDADQMLRRNSILKQKGVMAEFEYTSSPKTQEAAAAWVEQARAQLGQVDAQRKLAEARLGEAGGRDGSAFER